MDKFDCASSFYLISEKNAKKISLKYEYLSTKSGLLHPYQGSCSNSMAPAVTYCLLQLLYLWKKSCRRGKGHFCGYFFYDFNLPSQASNICWKDKNGFCVINTSKLLQKKYFAKSAALFKLVHLNPINLTTWQKYIYLAGIKPATSAICHVSYVICHVSCVMCPVSHVTCHVSLVTCPFSPFTCQMSPFTCH